MKRILVSGGSILVVIIIVLASFTNVVGVQTVASSKGNVITDEVDPKELLFQTILDMANNKEIQNTIRNSKIKGDLEKSVQTRGLLPLLVELRMPFSILLSPPKVLTMNYLRYIYSIGARLSRTIDISKMHSIIERYQVNNQEIQKDIAAVIERNGDLKEKMEQLANLQCDCENDDLAIWRFPVICTLLFPIFWLDFILTVLTIGELPFIEIIYYIGWQLNCWWNTVPV